MKRNGLLTYKLRERERERAVRRTLVGVVFIWALNEERSFLL